LDRDIVEGNVENGGEGILIDFRLDFNVSVRATPKPASSMAHSTVTRALALWAHI